MFIELKELKEEITSFKNGIVACLGESADVYYKTLGLNQYKDISLPFKFYDKFFSAMKEIGIKKEDIINACIIKYQTRLINHKKNLLLEEKNLKKYLFLPEKPLYFQRMNAAKGIEDLLSQKDYFKRKIKP